MVKPQMRRCEDCQLNRRLDRYAGPRGRFCDFCRRKHQRTRARKRHLGATYDVTPDEYAELLAVQNGKCAGCGEARPYNLAVDHDHAIVEQEGVRRSVRGLLCKRCNKVLRDVGDDLAVLGGLCRYLIMPPARKVLR